MSAIILSRKRPERLIAGNDTGGYWRHGQRSLLRQLSTGSTEVAADGDPVGYILDTMRRTVLSQATSGNRPLFDADTAPSSLLVNSSAFGIGRTGLSLDPATGFTVGCSFVPNANTNTHTLWTGDTSNFLLGFNALGDTVRVRCNKSTDETVAMTINVGTRYTLILRADGSNWTLYSNGLPIGTGTQGTAAATYTRISMPSSATNNNYNIFSGFFVNKAIAVSDIGDLNNALSS